MPQDPILAALDRVQGVRPPGADLLATSRRRSRLGLPGPGADQLIPAHRPEDDDILSALDRVQGGPTLTERVAPMAMRVGGAILGGIAGIPGGPPGILALGAGGAGVGEIAAQSYERDRGQREAFNPTQVAVQTGLGAIPMGRAFGATAPRIMASRAAQGGVLGGGATVATELAETGELPTLGQVGIGASLGAGLGGVLGGVEGATVARGARPAPTPPRGPVAALPPGAAFQVSPDGRVAPTGVDIPMTRTPDSPGVWSVDAAVVDFDAQGRPIYSSDPTARSVPRPVRGQLGAGPRFVGGPGGVVGSVEQADDILRALDEVQGVSASPPATADAPIRGLVPAAPLAYDIDPHVRAREAFSVRQYSSDPNASAAPLVSDDARRWLAAMREDLDVFTPQRGRLVSGRHLGDEGSSVYAHGGRGSYVGEDVRVISGRRVGNAEIRQAIDDLLEGRPPTTRLHTAVIDAAQGYAEGRPGYRGPQVRPEMLEQGRLARPLEAPPFVARRASSLPDDAAAVQERAASDLESRLDDYVDAYLGNYGRVLNADNASELFAEYAASPAARSALARAVRSPAASLTDELYRRLLREPVPDDLERVVLFTSGGNGSGKSTAIGAGNSAAITIDSTLSDFAQSKARIDEALNAGFDVNIAHVSRDPVEAFRAVLQRAAGEYQTGRPVPLTTHARTHRQAPAVLRQLAGAYADDPRVSIRAFSNEADGLVPVTMDRLAAREYPTDDALLSQLRATLDEEYAAGRVEPALYRAVSGQEPPSVGRGQRADFRGTAGPLRADDSAAGRQVPVRGAGTTPAPLDDFEQFSRLFDDIPPSSGREPGEAGFIAPMVAARLAGATGGAAYGAATGEDTEDRIGRAIMFGAAGAAAPSLLRAGRRGAPAAARSSLGTTDAIDGATPTRGSVPATGRSGRPRTEPMDGMDVFIGKFNPLVQAGIRERIAVNGGYDAQRRGVIDSKTLGRFANEVRISVEKTLPKGTALNAEAITAYARAVEQTQAKINTLAARVTSGAANDAEIVALQAARADADVLLKSIAGARTEAGRSLAALRFLGGVLETGDVNLIRGVADSMRDEARQLASGLAELPTDPLVRYRWLQTHGRPTLWQKARSVYYANILSGVKTHERNILGNVANILSEIAGTPAAATADAVRSGLTGAPRTVYLDELPAGAVGLVGGIERGWSDMWFTLRHGVSPDNLRRSVAAGEVGKLDIPRVEFAGGAGNPFNWPGRALDGADTFFRSVARNQELYRLAHTQAKREGLSGDKFVARVADIRAGLAPDAQVFREAAAEYARRSVFQEKPGRLASWVLQGHQVPVVGHIMPFVLPFIKTPANIFRQGLEFSPAGVLMKAARQGGRAGAQAQGRAIAGSMAAGYLAWLASTGRLSGNGPSDSAERAQLMEAGWRPNSVRIGDSWVSYQLFQPVSVQAALIGNAFEAWQQDGANPADAPDLIAQTIARSANSFLDQSFFAGMFDFVEALRDPERSASRFFGRVSQGAVPFIGALRTAQLGMDPVIRQPRGTKETFMASMPGLSERVEPRIDRFGEPVVREGGPLRRAADPLNVSSMVRDPIADELSRLTPIAEGLGLTGWPLSLPSDRVAVRDSRPVTRAEHTEVKQLRGRTVRQAVERLIATAGYERMNDEARARALDRLIDRARESGTEQFRATRTRRNQAAFAEWYARQVADRGLSANPNDPAQFYDFRAAWSAGVNGPDASGEWPAAFRQLGHPDLIVDGVDTRTGQPASSQLQRASETRRARILRQRQTAAAR